MLAGAVGGLTPLTEALDSVAVTLGTRRLSLLILIGLPNVHGQLETRTAAMVVSLQQDKLNESDEAELDRGYYEGLLNEGSRVSGMNALVTGNDRFTPESWMRPERRHRVR